MKIEKSKCCKAPVKVVSGEPDFIGWGDGITMHYECTKCHEACDIAQPDDWEKRLRDVFEIEYRQDTVEVKVSELITFLRSECSLALKEGYIKGYKEGSGGIVADVVALKVQYDKGFKKGVKKGYKRGLEDK